MIKNIWGFFTHRAFYTIVAMLVQLVLLVGMIWRFSSYFVYFYAGSVLLSAILVLAIINGRDNPAYKMAWIVAILLVPVFGGMIYLLFGHSGITADQRKQMIVTLGRFGGEVPPGDAPAQIAQLNGTAARQSHYITETAFCSPCTNTVTEYYPLGEIAFAQMKEAFEAAERYILLEYFIVQEGVMWNELLEILTRKAAEGLDVRLIYDDMGCMFTLPYHYERTLKARGIRCAVFNPFRPELTSRFNNRNHRKIAAVDGHIAFTGGINLADEYINAYEKHGHWKDSVLKLEGEGAWQLAAMALSMWEHLTHQREDYDRFRPNRSLEPYRDSPGFVQAYSDIPVDDEPVGKNVYMGLITAAERYVYITTPYLILDSELTTALILAAKSGVDVRIITPGQADKWYVHAVTRHNYERLVESGVHIFEYSPGFIHAKSFVADDEYAVVGTVNLDLRSLHLHFECGVWMYRTASVAEVYKDFLATEAVSREITLDECRSVPFVRRLGRSVLSLFSPLM